MGSQETDESIKSVMAADMGILLRDMKDRIEELKEENQCLKTKLQAEVDQKERIERLFEAMKTEAERAVENLAHARSNTERHRRKSVQPPSHPPASSDAPNESGESYGYTFDDVIRIVRLQRLLRRYIARSGLRRVENRYMDSISGSMNSVVSPKELASEVLSTERDYLTQLVLLESVFAHLKTSVNEKTFSSDDYDAISCNVAEFVPFHQQFLTHFQAMARSIGVGVDSPAVTNKVEQVTLVMNHLATLKDMLPTLQEYCDKYFMSLVVFSRVCSTKGFRQVLDLAMDKAHVSKGADSMIRLGSQMLVPLVRIGRYVGFMRDILNKAHSLDMPQSALNEFEICSALVKDAAETAQETVSQSQSMRSLLRVQSVVSGLMEGIVDPGRALIKEGWLQKADQQDLRKKAYNRYFFLFNDMLIYAAAADRGNYSYKGHMSFADIEDVLEDVEFKGKGSSFRLKTMKKMYVLRASSPSEKSEWYRALNTQLVLFRRHHAETLGSKKKHASLLNKMNIFRLASTTFKSQDGDDSEDRCSVSRKSASSPRQSALARPGSMVDVGQDGNLHWYRTYPLAVEKLLLLLQEHGPSVEEIFRESCNAERVKEMYEAMAKDEANTCPILLSNCDWSLCASVLKQFLREHVPSLGGDFDIIVATGQTTSRKSITPESLVNIIANCSPMEYDVFVLLLEVLHGIAESKQNAMDARALGTAVAPSIFRSLDPDDVTQEEVKCTVAVLSEMIANAPTLLERAREKRKEMRSDAWAPDAENPWLLPGERIITYADIVTVRLYPFEGMTTTRVDVTNFRTRLAVNPLPLDRASSLADALVGGWEDTTSMSIPHSVIASLDTVPDSKNALRVVCKDIRTFIFGFSGFDSSGNRIKSVITRHMQNGFIQNLFAFSYLGYPKLYEAGDKAGLYDIDEDFGRIGIPNSCYVINKTMNANFKVCSTYPEALCVPAKLTEEQLIAAAGYRSRNRLPACCWLLGSNFAALFRASQPLSGLRSKKCAEDVLLFQEMCNATRERGAIKILDMRPRLNAMANAAMGKGVENVDAYPNCSLLYMDIDNIHVMRDSLRKLMTLVLTDQRNDEEWLTNVHATGWLSHVSKILNAGVTGAKLMLEGFSVLVHCSDGWDRTAQVTALIQLLLDPHYRTYRGFQQLIQKEWTRFGHKFADRCGQGESRSSNDQRSPVFLQFLDCVYQCHQQFPSAFEFNVNFLIRLNEELLACRFGNFLGDSERERSLNLVDRKCASVWQMFNSPACLSAYNNPMYKRKEGYLPVRPTVRFVQLWREFFCRYTD
eukprot:Rmarinus@m.23121